MRVTGCQLIPTDNSQRHHHHHHHHHHLESCEASESEPRTKDDDYPQKTLSESSSPDQIMQSLSHREFASEAESKVNTTDSSTKITASGLPCWDQVSDLKTGMCHCPSDVTCSDSKSEPGWRTVDDVRSITGPVCSVLDTVCCERTDSSQRRSNHHNPRLTEPRTEEISSASHVSMKCDWFHVDRAVIGELNDVFWVESCLKALHQLIQHHHHQHQQPCQYQLLVLSRTPTFFPVAALRLGLVSDLHFLDLDPVHRPLIGRLLAANDISQDHVTFGGNVRLRDVISVLFADIVSSEGCLRQNVFELFSEARSVRLSFLID